MEPCRHEKIKAFNGGLFAKCPCGAQWTLTQTEIHPDQPCTRKRFGHACNETGIHTKHVAENAAEGGADLVWHSGPDNGAGVNPDE
jgi:hypothetical protein